MIRINPITMDIEMIKRDTGPISVRPILKGTQDEYLLTDGATLHFTLRKLQDRSIVMEKSTTEFEDGIGSIVLESSDTEDIEEGTYIYDLVVIRSDGTRDTLIPEGRDSLYFVIKRGVKQGQ
jgi:hypothetical protein